MTVALSVATEPAASSSFQLPTRPASGGGELGLVGPRDLGRGADQVPDPDVVELAGPVLAGRATAADVDREGVPVRGSYRVDRLRHSLIAIETIAGTTMAPNSTCTAVLDGLAPAAIAIPIASRLNAHIWLRRP